MHDPAAPGVLGKITDKFVHRGHVFFERFAGFAAAAKDVQRLTLREIRYFQNNGAMLAGNKDHRSGRNLFFNVLDIVRAAVIGQRGFYPFPATAPFLLSSRQAEGSSIGFPICARMRRW